MRSIVGADDLAGLYEELDNMRSERDALLDALEDIHDNPDGARLKAAAAIEKFRGQS